MSESKGLKKSSSSSSVRSSRVRDYPGRFFVFSDKNSTKQVQEIKKLLTEYGADASEIKMDFKPWIKSALFKLTKKDTAPQVFFNTKYIGSVEDLSDLNTNGVLRTMIEDAKQDSNNGELLELYRNQSECFEYSPDTIYFPPPYGRGITCIINVRNKTENYAVFKIKTTNRDAYAVKPRKGVINPLETQQISISLQASATTVSPEDKFRFEAVLLSMFSEELKKNIEIIFEKADQKMLMKKKIECSFTQPPPNFKVKQFQDGNIIIEQQMSSSNEEDFSDFGVPHIDSTPTPELTPRSPEPESTKENAESNELFHSVISDSQPSEIAQLTPRTPRNEEVETEQAKVTQTPEASTTVVEESPVKEQPEPVKSVQTNVESVPEVSKEPESLPQPPTQEVQEEPEKQVEPPLEKPAEKPTEIPISEPVAEPLPQKEVTPPPSSPVIVPAPALPVPTPTPETTPVHAPVTEEEQFNKYTQTILETVKAREVAKAETKKLIETIDKKEFEQLKQQYESLLSQLKLKDEEILAINQLKGEIVVERNSLQSQLNLKEDRINDLQHSLTKERNESSKLLSSKEKRLSELESEVEQYKAIKGRPKETGASSEEKKPIITTVKTQETPEGIPVVVVIIIALVFFLIGKIF